MKQRRIKGIERGEDSFFAFIFSRYLPLPCFLTVTVYALCAEGMLLASVEYCSVFLRWPNTVASNLA